MSLLFLSGVAVAVGMGLSLMGMGLAIAYTVVRDVIRSGVEVSR